MRKSIKFVISISLSVAFFIVSSPFNSFGATDRELPDFYGLLTNEKSNYLVIEANQYYYDERQYDTLLFINGDSITDLASWSADYSQVTMRGSVVYGLYDNAIWRYLYKISDYTTESFTVDAALYSNWTYPYQSAGTDHDLILDINGTVNSIYSTLSTNLDTTISSINTSISTVNSNLESLISSISSIRLYAQRISTQLSNFNEYWNLLLDSLIGGSDYITEDGYSDTFLPLSTKLKTYTDNIVNSIEETNQTLTNYLMYANADGEEGYTNPFEDNVITDQTANIESSKSDLQSADSYLNVNTATNVSSSVTEFTSFFNQLFALSSVITGLVIMVFLMILIRKIVGR